MKNTNLNKNCSRVLPLRAINENWTIDFIQNDGETAKMIKKEPMQLEFIADFNKVDYKTCIERWLKKYSKNHLLPWIDKISQQTGLHYQCVSIRGQKTRWGSCSEQHTISLNYKLLFLPQKLVNHLLLHELCHTVHLDHSDNFWQLLASHDRHWYETKLHCRKAHHYVPSWLER